jgi:3'-phosphoadenosine 5'-phosphosulfate sulfotransferase (PAPS reductase)/FAD synthetase
MKDFHQYPFPVKFLKYYLEKEVFNLCNDFINKNKNTMLALSFGKDSMTILHILSKYNLLNKLKIIMFNNSGFESDDTKLMINYVIDHYKIKNYIETNIDDPEKYIKMDIENSLKKGRMIEFAYNVLEKPRWAVMDKYNIDSTIIGLRKEESKGRRINYFLRGKEYYNKRELSNILQPIVNWKILDIFSYAYSEKIPLNSIYYKSKKFGFDYKKTRVNTLASLDATGYELDRVKVNQILFPKEFNSLLNKIPEIRRFL